MAGTCAVIGMTAASLAGPIEVTPAREATEIPPRLSIKAFLCMLDRITTPFLSSPEQSRPHAMARQITQVKERMDVSRVDPGSSDAISRRSV